MSIFKRVINMVKKAKNKKQSADPHYDREAQKYASPIPSREYILAELMALTPPVKMRVLREHFDLPSEDAHEAFRRRIKAMIRDGQLMKTPKGYFPVTSQGHCEGILQVIREGDGFLITEKGQKIFLGGPSLRGYYDGDKVQIQITHLSESGQSRGRILALLEPVTPKIVGRLIQAPSHWEVLPFDRKLTQNVLVKKGVKRDAQSGDIVQVKIHREAIPKAPDYMPEGDIIDVLGDPETPGIEVEVAVRKFDIPHQWPKNLLKDSKKLAEKKLTLHGGRQDITHLPLVTIDGEDAKDFDDAVFCEPKKRGGWTLTVAIADVSYYVTPGSALDVVARERGNSTYFPGMVIPMLPEILSNELCSLKPNVPRYCVACEMQISAKGDITRYTFYRALMESKARLTYTEVAEIVNGHKVLSQKYESLVPALESLRSLYEVLHAKRRQRGAIDFDTIETKILFDKQNKIQSIIPTERNIAHKMIEECMLAANVCAAKFIEGHKYPGIFRVHERPPADKLTALKTFLAECGLDLGGRETPNANDFSKLMERIKGREDRHVIETVMLRSLSQAQYSTENVGHFGLAYESYTHFTSPIRRYPDLLVHRAILTLVKEPKQKSKVDVDALEHIALQCSQTERRSDEATRDAAMALKCHYMQDKVGECFRGVISGVASFGLFVELKDIFVEGLIHVTALSNEYFQYDPTHHRMVGERTRKVYRLGDPVDVMVVRVDIEAKKIDLELVVQEKSRPSRKAKGKVKTKTKTKNTPSVDKPIQKPSEHKPAKNSQAKKGPAKKRRRAPRKKRTS